MGKQKTQKYIPVKHAREKNTFIEEYYSAPDVEIKINDKNINYISAIQFAINEQVKPIYGYQSRTYDDIAIGTRLVTGVIRVPIKNNNKNDIETKRSNVNTLMTESQLKSDKPSWIRDNSLLADVFDNGIKSVSDNDKIISAITTDDIYIYMQPSLKDEISKIEKGTQLKILKEVNEVYKIKTNNICGYTRKICIRKI